MFDIPECLNEFIINSDSISSQASIIHPRNVFQSGFLIFFYLVAFDSEIPVDYIHELKYYLTLFLNGLWIVTSNGYNNPVNPPGIRIS